VALCTTCSKRKRREPASPSPALHRYASRRIRHVAAVARTRGLPVLVLSGRYGLVSSRRRIPWYDHPLEPPGVPALAAKLARQLEGLDLETLELWARPASTPGWRPYHDALRLACAAAGVRLRKVLLDESWL
jgi:hypothetical protein